jgi:hypothetical protein
MNLPALNAVSLSRSTDLIGVLLRVTLGVMLRRGNQGVTMEERSYILVNGAAAYQEVTR